MELEESKSVLKAVIPHELPIYRFKHPYGCITIYTPTGEFLSPERVYMLLEQAKHDLLAQHMYSIKDPQDVI